MGVLGWIKDVFIIFVCVQVVWVWLSGAEFSLRLGIYVLILMLMSLVFILQRIGIIPSHKGR